MCRCPEGFYGFNCEKSNEKPATRSLCRWCRRDDLQLDHYTPYSKIDYSLVCVLISPLCLVYKYEKQKNFEVKMRQKV